MRKILIVLALVLSGLASGCALASVLPTVITVVQDAILIIDEIQGFVDQHFAGQPDPVKQRAVQAAIGRARTALDLALRTSKGTADLSDKQMTVAMDEFRAAYADLLSLVEPMGVHQVGSQKLMASPAGLIVPSPLALTLR